MSTIIENVVGGIAGVSTRAGLVQCRLDGLEAEKRMDAIRKAIAAEFRLVAVGDDAIAAIEVGLAQASQECHEMAREYAQLKSKLFNGIRAERLLRELPVGEIDSQIRSVRRRKLQCMKRQQTIDADLAASSHDAEYSRELQADRQAADDEFRQLNSQEEALYAQKLVA